MVIIHNNTYAADSKVKTIDSARKSTAAVLPAWETYGGGGKNYIIAGLSDQALGNHGIGHLHEAGNVGTGHVVGEVTL